MPALLIINREWKVLSNAVVGWQDVDLNDSSEEMLISPSSEISPIPFLGTSSHHLATGDAWSR